MLALVSLLPIAIYLLIIKAMDAFALAKWSRLGLCMCWGVTSCIIVRSLALLIGWESSIVSPVLEEVIKFILPFLLVSRKKIAFFAEALIYGVAVGAGFSLLENSLYLLYNPDEMNIGTAIVRGFGTALIHMGCTALCTNTALTVSRFVYERKIPTSIKMAFMAVGLLPSIAIHFVYNLSFLAAFVQLFAVLFLFFGLFALIYHIEQKLIHKWLDCCINNDIALLSAIKLGQLSTTNAGSYLINVKDHFNPEIFFDICMYVSLYLELTISAKSRMILKEAGIDEKLNDATRRENAEKMQELDALRKNIGLTGRQVLKPILHESTTDQWVLDELL